MHTYVDMYLYFGLISWLVLSQLQSWPINWPR